MNTAQILYEQFKVLPRRVKNELKTLIENEGDEYVDISLPAFKDAVKQVKLFKEGKIEARPISELLKELENEI